MKEPKCRSVRDPIHGFVELPSDLFETLIDTELFQRLRDVKQLGLTHLVYPSATHTRFEHSLGTAAVLKRMIESVLNNTREILPSVGPLRQRYEEVMRELEELLPEAIVAALLHDIGHMALSHVSEKVQRDLGYLKGEGALPITVNHEGRSLIVVSALIKEKWEVKYKGKEVSLAEVKEILEAAYTHKTRARFLRNPTPRNNAKLIVAQLISSEIDVDRGDFVLRDAYAAGVALGSYDLNRLYKVVALVPSKDNKELLKVGILDKGVSVIESMLLGRVFMYKDVYLHTISMLYSALAVRVLSLVLKREDLKGLLPEIDAFRKAYHASVDSLTEALLSVTDSTFHQMLLKLTRVFEGKVAKGELRLDEDLLTLYLLAKSILSRRRWSYLLASEDLSEEVVKAYAREDLRETLLSLIGERHHPAVILFHSKYTGYAGGVLVAKRSNPLEVRPLEEYTASVVAKELKDKTFSKLILVFPEVESDVDLEKWHLKPGRVRDLLGKLREAHLRGFGEELKEEDYFRDSFSAAIELAKDIERAFGL